MKDSHEGAASNTRGVEESARKAQEKWSFIIFAASSLFARALCCTLYVALWFVRTNNAQKRHLFCRLKYFLF